MQLAELHAGFHSTEVVSVIDHIGDRGKWDRVDLFSEFGGNRRIVLVASVQRIDAEPGIGAFQILPGLRQLRLMKPADKAAAAQRKEPPAPQL